MIRTYPRFFLLLASLFALLQLSGCFADKSFTLFPDLENGQDAPDIQETDDPEMQLVMEDQEIGLDHELAVLSRTGNWRNRTQEFTTESDDDVIHYDFPITMNNQVEAYIDLFQNKQKKMFSRWLARSTRYLPYMQAELKKAGLPQDLAYLSMIESGYNQLAYSRAKAVGLWQFMRATGRQYSLNVDNYVDERRDLEKSTKAAVAFLGDLYKDFGDWHLAVAAYNAGPGKVRNGMKRYQVDNFWDLAQQNYLSLETKRYVPKLLAAIIISKEPEKYGFTDVAYAPALHYATIDVGPGLPLDAVAVIADSSVSEIKELNPELRKGSTPLNRKEYAVKIPGGSRALAEKNIDRLHSYVSTGYLTHKIRRGETVKAICRKYNINTKTLLKVNNLRSSQLVAGTNLRIPYSTVKYQILPEGTSSQIAAYKDNLILHQIKKGETISTIARKYSVPPELIVAWNGLKSVHKIRAGQQLALYVHNQGPAPSAPKSSAGLQDIALLDVDNLPAEQAVQTQADGRPVFAAQKKKAPTAAPADAVEYSWYKVKNGDSLWTISRKFNISEANIRKWNNLKSNLIHPGSRLKLKNV